MISPWIGIVGVSLVLVLMILILKWIASRYELHPELVRKMLHVGMGIVILSFPWVFDRVWPVVVLSTLSALSMSLLRVSKLLSTGIGSILNGVDRVSWGEVYYPISVGLLFWWTQGDRLMFIIPILILSLADATAALIGVRYGQASYFTCDSRKSLEGSIGFFIVAFFSIHAPLLLFSSIGRVETLLISIVIALLVMLFEGMAWWGLDNLFIPLGSYLLLTLYRDLGVEALVVRLLATIMLTVFAIVWRERCRLDDGALLGTAVFGYTAWNLGGWLWLLPPLSLFIQYVLFYPISNEKSFVCRKDTVPLIVAISINGLFWLVLYHWSGDLRLIWNYGVSFGVHMATLKLSISQGFTSSRVSLRELVLNSIMGSSLALIPIIIFRGMNESWIVAAQLGGLGFAVITLVTYLFYSVVEWFYSPAIRKSTHYINRLAASTLASAGMAMIFLIL